MEMAWWTDTPPPPPRGDIERRATDSKKNQRSDRDALRLALRYESFTSPRKLASTCPCQMVFGLA